MKKDILGIITLVAIFLGISFSQAATIHLKNGRTMEGVIKSQDDKVIRLDIGGGVITIKKEKVVRIEEGDKGDEVLPEKRLRKVIITRKMAPKHLLPYVYDYNEVREEYKTILNYNDEAKAISADRPKLMKGVEVYEKKIREFDGELKKGKDALGINRYNDVVIKQNALHANARSYQANIQWGRQRLPILRGKINDYRNGLIELLSRVSESQKRISDPEPNEALFFDELQVRIKKLIDQVSGRYVQIEKNQGAHTVVEVKINGRITVPMLVDTGASTVTLSTVMAKNLGLKINKKNAVEMRIANGEVVKGYHVLLESVSVEGLEAKQVIATVMDGPPSDKFEGLLGMTFLENFELSMSPQTGTLELRETNF